MPLVANEVWNRKHGGAQECRTRRIKAVARPGVGASTCFVDSAFPPQKKNRFNDQRCSHTDTVTWLQRSTLFLYAARR
jgi:hypothetical protein